MIKVQNFTAVLCLILCLSVPYLSHAQIIQDDFEGSGTITNWYGDDCGMNTAFVNPVQQGDNPSATVLRYDDTGGQYANVQFRMNEKFDLNEKNTFSLQIYVPSSGVQGNAPRQISLKLQDGSLQDS